MAKNDLKMLIENKAWFELLKPIFEKEYFKKLNIAYEKEAKAFELYPPRKRLFYAFNLCKLEDIKIIILGQDPYHKKDLANGLAFSVDESVRLPLSLQNIFKELRADLGCDMPMSGDLSPWSRQGVLMINASFSVRQNQANSHAKLGWLDFTKDVLSLLCAQKKDLVFILWGAFAAGFEPILSKHFIIKSAHPSPLSANRGFFGSRPFSRANEALRTFGKKEIIWCDL